MFGLAYSQIFIVYLSGTRYVSTEALLSKQKLYLNRRRRLYRITEGPNLFMEAIPGSVSVHRHKTDDYGRDSHLIRRKMKNSPRRTDAARSRAATLKLTTVGDVIRLARFQKWGRSAELFTGGLGAIGASRHAHNAACACNAKSR